MGLWAGAQIYAAANGAWTNSNATVPFDAWSHLAVVFDGSEVRFYIDGVQDAASPSAGSLGPINSEDVYVATLPTNEQNYEGDVFAMRVSSVARYTGNFAPATAWSPDVDTSLLMMFDEGSGGLAYDTSTNGHVGTINGATWITGLPSWLCP